MHDLREIRTDPDQFAVKLESRGEEVDISALLELDNAKKELTRELDVHRQKRNSSSKLIGSAKKKGLDTSKMEAEIKQLNHNLKAGGEMERELGEKIRRVMLQMPNLPTASTPPGLSESENVLLRTWGEEPKIDFEPLDHLEIGQRLNMLDFKRGGKITGTGFPLWTGYGAALERALINFMLDLQTENHGYTEMLTPFMANRDSMIATGQIPHLEEDMYKIDQDDLFLIPTSEVTLINLHRDELIEEKQLPLRYTAYSPCFRREAGAHGHDTRGFLRVHQFNKVEMVQIVKPEFSYEVWQRMIEHAEEVLRQLDLRYRVLHLCAGDLGFQAAECCDLEVWSHADGGRWLEVSSVSNCLDFQARRANIRVRPAGGGKPYFPHTLNGSGVATSRLTVALLETWQTEEGSLVIPPVLRSYMGGKTIITENGMKGSR